MPKLSDTEVPSYRLHKQSGQALVTLNGRDICLGVHNTRDSKTKYSRVIAEWLAAGRQLPTDSGQISIVEIMVGYWRHAQAYYRKADGTQTGEASRIKRELAPLKRLYGRTPAMEFGPLKLKAVRDDVIALKWCRTSVNHAIGTIKRMFRWATENELLPSNVFHALQSVTGLKAGRSEAPESEPVQPVADAHALAILPLVSRQVGAMIQLQLITAMRPGEACAMRGCDLDTTTKLWAYKPAEHKIQHHGHDRVVYLGPQAQQIIKPFLKLDPRAYLFDPREAEAERLAKLHAARVTPLNQGTRPGMNKNRRRARAIGERYTVQSYRRAVSRGCDAAFPLPERLTVETLTYEQRTELATWRDQHRFHPHQLRHGAATRLRKQHGLEAAQVLLGHRTLSVTQVYAQANVEKAQRVMSEVG